MNVSDQVAIDMTTFDGATVEVTIRKETRRLKCKKYDLGEGREMVCIYGTAGRYSTGTKDWPATLEPRIDPRDGKQWINARFGFDSRSGKHSQRPTVFFK